MNEQQIDYTEISNKIINEVVKISFGQFMQKIEVGAEDVAKTVVDELKEKSLHAILETIVFYRSISKDEGFLFPSGTRFLFNRGPAKIVAIEQPPQVRTVRLCESLWGPERTQKGALKSFSLAFPYVIFIVVMTNELQKIYVYFRNTPLRSLDSNLYKAVFSNLDTDNSVCRSEDASSTSDPLNVKIEASIAAFWQSTFNSDLDTHWRSRTDIDSRLNLTAWRAQSQIEPMFPCSIEWVKSPHTLGEAMEIASVRQTARESVSEGSDQKVSSKLTEMMNETSVELSDKLKKYLTAERLDRFCPKDVKKDLSSIIEGMCGEMEALIRNLVRELGVARQRIERQSEDVSWEAEQGGLWG